MMEITRSQQGPVTTLILKGPLVAGELDALDARIEECVSSGIVKIILEMRRVPFIDSVGLERIQSAVSDLGSMGGNLCVVSPTDVCRDIFVATRMDHFLIMCEDRESALRNLQ
jgi:anti-anti-sigma factor